MLRNFKAFWGLFIIVATSTLSVFAFEEESYLIVQGELLYLASSYDETYFVINGSGVDILDNPTPNGKKINNPVGYNFGFRLEGTYGFCHSCVDFRLRWTHVYGTSETTVSNLNAIPQLWPTENIPSLPNIPEPYSGTAFSHIGTMYQKGECLLNEKVCDLNCWHFTLREGIEWSYLRYHEVVEYRANSGALEINQFHGHTKGIGPQLGILAFCEPWAIFEWYPRHLSFKFMTTASLIAANSKAKLKSTGLLDVMTNNVTQSSFWRLVPEWNFTFGINYLRCFCPCQVSVEIGYEMTTYFRGTSKLIFDEASSPGHSFNQYSDFYVHGLYLAFSVFY